MNRSKIIQHYKSFFDIEDMWLAENDHLMIDWAEDLVKNCIKPPVIKSLPEPDEIRMKARELDEKDFAQWMYELQKGNVL